AVRTYIQEAFKKVADARSLKYVDDLTRAYYTTPTERLVQQNPELFEKITIVSGQKIPRGVVETPEGLFKPVALMRQEELAEATRLVQAIKDVERGGKLPTSALRAFERRFPELGRRLRKLAQAPTVGEEQLREYLAKSFKDVRVLQAELKRARVAAEGAPRGPVPKLEPAAELPDELKLREAFKLMSHDDRSTFRAAMNTQMEDIGEAVLDQGARLIGAEDFLRTDPVANFRATVTTRTGKQRQMSLISLLKQGQWPETLTKQQAEILLLGRPLRAGVVNAEGRVRWEYILDELAEHFGMQEAAFIRHVEAIAAAKREAIDLKLLLGDASIRTRDIERMVNILDDVDVDITALPQKLAPMELNRPPEPGAPEIPKAEPGMPEAGLQKGMFGYDQPVFPKGKGEVTQMSMDSYLKLTEQRKAAGLPPPNTAVKPQAEGIPELAGQAEFAGIKQEVPLATGAKELQAELRLLRLEAEAM
ncbi:hypothetical protein LCGC14_2560340, partial [marine sediment metagenome]